MAERKHLFGTTEKSDFVVNMTDEGTKKLCGLYCIISMLLIQAIAIPYYVAKNIVRDYVANQPVYWSETILYWLLVVMFGIGVIGLCVFLIGKMKSQFLLKDNKLLLFLLGLVIISFISSVCSSEALSSVTGFTDRTTRAEGFLTLTGYYGFFVSAFTIVGDSWRKKVCGFIIGIGAGNALVGMLQVMPGICEKMPNDFSKLQWGMISMESHDVCASNGLAMTPHALSALLTISFAIAFSAVIFEKGKAYKLLSAVSSILMIVSAMFTHTITAIVGIGSAALIVTVMGLICAVKNGDKSKRKAILILSVAGALIAAAISVTTIKAGKIELYDEEIIRTDSVRMNTLLNLDINKSIYPYLWEKGLDVANQNPILGVGPDNYAEIAKTMSIDRCYNEYIDTAVQRGYIAFALYIILLVITLKKSFTAIKIFMNDKCSWAAVAVTCAVMSYMIQAFFNISSVTSSPFFWICAGLIWSYSALSESKKEKDKAK